MRIHVIILLTGISIFVTACGPPVEEEAQICRTVTELDPGAACFSASVSNGGTLNIINATSENVTAQRDAAAIDADLTPLQGRITNRVWNSNTGQLVDQQDLGTFNSSAAPQVLTLWDPSPEIAAGRYDLEWTVDFGVCGIRTECAGTITVVK